MACEYCVYDKIFKILGHKIHLSYTRPTFYPASSRGEAIDWHKHDEAEFLKLAAYVMNLPCQLCRQENANGL